MEVTPDEVRSANSSNIQVTRSWKRTKSGVYKKTARHDILHVPFANPIAVIAMGPAMFRRFAQNIFREGLKAEKLFPLPGL
jgi:hypothetical protein